MVTKMKYVVFLGDGMSDLPVPELGGATPLEKARHPQMDRLAREGIFGLAKTVPDHLPAGSETANLAVFGYDPAVYYAGRSPLEAASMGINLREGDVAYRCNMITLDGGDTLETCFMKDYSAGEITSEETAELIAFINRKFTDDGYRLYPGVSYRNCLVVHRSPEGAVLTPPHDISGKPVAEYLPSGPNAELFREMMTYAFETLKDHPVNRRRAADGKNPANAIWFWGEGHKYNLPSYAELFGVKGAVISAVDLVQGIGRCAGLEIIRVPGTTGNYHTDFAAKGKACIDAFKNGADFVYVHVEAPDECGHHHEINEKIWSIEQIDEKIMAPVLDWLEASGEAYAALVMPDHPTPLVTLTHSREPVPFALYRSEAHFTESRLSEARFTESGAKATGIYVPQAHKIAAAMFRGDLTGMTATH